MEEPCLTTKGGRVSGNRWVSTSELLPLLHLLRLALDCEIIVVCVCLSSGARSRELRLLGLKALNPASGRACPFLGHGTNSIPWTSTSDDPVRIIR